MKYGLWPEINHRIIGIYTEFIQKYNLQRKSLRECARIPRFWEEFVMDRIGDARIFGAVRAENKSKNLYFAESREK